jgi:hypothetical protein
MIRPFTLISAVLFVLSGAYLFAVKHNAQVLDDEIAAKAQATQLDEQRIRVLQAQWALEADPSRLAALAAQFTALQPMKPGQLVTMAALGTSLPAPGAKPPGGNPEDPVPALPQLAAAAPAAATPGAAPGAAATIVAAAAPATAGVQTAANVPPAVPAAAASVHLASAAVPAPAVPHYHSVTPARYAAAMPVHHVIPPRPPQGSSVYMASASGTVASAHGPMGAQLVPVRAVATPAPAPADDGGSMLGMAQDGSQ